MPLREFKCKKCGEDFEELVFDHWPNPECPECGTTDLKQKMSVCNHKIAGYSYKNSYEDQDKKRAYFTDDQDEAW